MNGQQRSIMKTTSYVLAVLFCLSSFHAQADGWLQRATLPADARLAPTSFGLGGKLFLVGGQHQVAGSDYDMADCWEFDPLSNAWAQKADFGGGLISRGVAFSIGSLGYVGWGTTFPAGQLWAYDAFANEWTQKATAALNLPTSACILSSSFVVAGKAYVCGGLATAPRSDLWEYDPTVDTWTQRTQFPGGGRYGAIAFSANGKGYLGTGTDGTNEQQDMWSYDPASDSWLQLGNFPGAARSTAAAFSIGTRGFVHGGVDVGVTSFNDLWEFNALNGSWTQRASNVSRYLGTASSAGGKGYFGMGNLGSNFNDWWEYTPEPQLDCLGVPNGTALPGATCDDGNGNTSNDVYTAACMCAGTPNNAAGWVQRADFGAGQRAGGFSFALNGLGYMGGGLVDQVNTTNTVWSYDPGTNAWSQVASLPVNASAGAVGFTIGGSGYVFLGQNNNLLAYDHLNNTWISREPLPASARFRPFGFAIGAYGYIGGGRVGTDPVSDFWRYDPNTDSWLQRADISGVARWVGASFTVDGIGYVFGGADASFNDLNDLQAYNPDSNTWSTRASLPSTGRRAATGFSIGHAGYVACGSTTSNVRFNECWEYHPGTNDRAQVADPGPEGRSSAMAFTVGGNGYLVGGLTGDGSTLSADARMYTQDAQPDCNGVIGGPVVPGTSCDDGLAYTGNDAINGFCACSGACLNDADGDGICDEVDACPNVAGQMWSACDDANACTVNDVLDATCLCVGTFMDSDSDGICDTTDNCPNQFGQQGDTCDDGDGNTVNDVITANCTCAGTAYGWIQQASMLTGFERSSASAFSIGNVGYVCAGINQLGSSTNDLWAFDAITNAWSQGAELPGGARYGAVGFSLGQFGYVSTGRVDPQIADYDDDLWRYDPGLNSWAAGPVLPGGARYAAVAFTAEGKAYVGTGENATSQLSDLWEFDPIADAWTGRQALPLPNGLRFATAFSADNKGHVCTGIDGSEAAPSFHWEYDAASDAWTDRTPIPNSGAVFGAVGFSIANVGYVCTGTYPFFGIVPTTLSWKYLTTTDSWEQIANCGANGRTAAVGFSIGSKGYVATGSDAMGGVQGDLWEYTPENPICVVGSPCDDGLAYTQNDALNASCACVGACLNDYDSDGICDEVDDCPFLALAIGSPCDDFNVCTENDVVQPWCGCYGTPLPDSDNDGVCDVADYCPNDVDTDNDGTCDATDNCPTTYNPDQADVNNDGLGDICNPYVIQTATHGCSTYKLLSMSSWTNAEAAAQALGGHLVAINDAAENTFVYQTFTQNGTMDRGLWIGLNDLANEGQFVWSSGDPLVYTNWDGGNPDNGGGIENCAGLLWPSFPDPYPPGIWVDLPDHPNYYGAPMFGVVEIDSSFDSDNDGTCDALDSCPLALPDLANFNSSACTCNSGSTSETVQIGANTVIVACTTACTETVTVELRTDALSSQASWQILAQSTNTVLCQYSVPIDGITNPITADCCLPVGCYRLRVTDSGGDGFVGGGITGGYQLRESGVAGRRIIDNLGNFTGGSSSQVSNTYDNGAFCVPTGADKLIFASCDKMDWTPNTYLVVQENTMVSPYYGGPNAAVTGYEFWIFDPNGTYSFRRFRSHTVSDGFSPASATRACHMKINSWLNTPASPHIPANVLLNVRVRGRIILNGSPRDLPFGPACLFKIDASRAACPLTRLQDNPSNIPDFSCGVTRNFGGPNGGANKLVANPPQFVPAVLSGNVRFQFRFRLPGEIGTPGACIIRPAQSSPTLYLNWVTGDKLRCGRTYEVDVRASKDAGATWCIETTNQCDAITTPWGRVCTVTIGTSTYCPPALTGGSSNLALQQNGRLTMYPNPNQGDQLFVAISSLAPDVDRVTMDLFDLTGKRITSQMLMVIDGELNTKIDLRNELGDGLYLVQFTAGSSIWSQRLVITR